MKKKLRISSTIGLFAASALVTACAEAASDATRAESALLASPRVLAAWRAPEDHTTLPRSLLLGWASLSQRQRTPGPTSGQFSEGANGVEPPFVDAQPVPGWSGLLLNDDGSFTAMPDNGYGAKGTSADFVLGYYNVDIAWKRWTDGTSKAGAAVDREFIAFNDRDGLLDNARGTDLVITADRANYFSGEKSGADSSIAVDPRIQQARLLTGYDFDVESIARIADGTFWVGEEFGPYLLHFDCDGTLLDEPLPHPFLKSPDNPDVLTGRATATLAASRGFESLAYDKYSKRLYAVTEAAPLIDELRAVSGDESVLEIFEIDPEARAYTGRTFKYRKDGLSQGNAIWIGDVTNVAPHTFVVIERDSLEGPEAAEKRLYIVNLGVTDDHGYLEKRLLVDLLQIADPLDIAGDLDPNHPHALSFPFVSVESVTSVSPRVLAVAIDTNFPGDSGRVPGRPDDTEVVEIGFERPIWTYAPQPTR